MPDRGTVTRIDGQDYKSVPANIEAEQALLGAILLNNDAYPLVVDIITKEHFHNEANRLIFDVISKLVINGKPATPVTCATWLGDDATKFEGRTVTAYLSHLAATATTVLNAPHYAEGIRDLWIRRRMIDICENAAKRAYDSPVELPAAQLIDEIEQAVGEVRPAAVVREGFKGFAQLAKDAVTRASSAYAHDIKMVGVSTGFSRLDAALGGLAPGDLVIVAGRPGMGKTAFATNIATNIASDPGHGVVGFFSLEMSGEQVVHRVLAEKAAVSSWRVRQGKVSEAEITNYVELASDLRHLPLVVDDTGSLTVQSLSLRARSLKKRRGLRALVVDYIQLLSSSSRAREYNRVQEITEITKSLKLLAKELEVPIIALSQLSRQVEMREDKRPHLADLRDSGSIEQDADVVMFLYRPEYYMRHQTPPVGAEARAEFEEKAKRAQGRAEVIIAKQRHGPLSTVEMGFKADTTSFTNEPPVLDEPVPEKRETKARAKSLPPEATKLWGLIKSLSMTKGFQANGEHPQAPHNALLVRAEDAREAFGRELYGADAKLTDIDRTFRAATRELVLNDLVKWAGVTGNVALYAPSLNKKG